MDTRFWGPSAWQLFHLIAFKSPHPEEFLNSIGDILPCRFCRESTGEFVKKHPLKGDPGKWLYDIHNRVNHKLHTQAESDPSVIMPDTNPSFDEVKPKHDGMKPFAVPGRDYLFTVAVNYPDKPEPEQTAVQEKFIRQLTEVYPFDELRSIFQSYSTAHPVTLQSRKTYMHWMYGLLKQLSKKTGSPIRSFVGYAHHVAYYKSGCEKKKYHGKTCRKVAGGGHTKTRSHRKTHRIAHTYLL